MTAEVTEAYAMIYRKSLKYVLGVTQNTPSILAYLATGVITPTQIAEVRLIGVARRLINLRGINLDPWTRSRIIRQVTAAKQALKIDQFDFELTNK